VWRRPEDQDAKVFLDAVKSVLDSRGNEDKAAGLDLPILIRDPDCRSAADHVIDLVFGMRSLPVGRLARPDRETYAQLVGGHEVDVTVTFRIARLRIEPGDFEYFH
jgi:hypothetical protein